MPVKIGSATPSKKNSHSSKLTDVALSVLFNKLDANGDDGLTLAEFRKIFDLLPNMDAEMLQKGEKYLVKIFKDADKSMNSDGKLNLTEFKEAYNVLYSSMHLKKERSSIRSSSKLFSRSNGLNEVVTGKVIRITRYGSAEVNKYENNSGY
jgi:hypothetical protein